MADYKSIKGFNVETIAGDPANPIAGQVWYNSTSATLKAYGQQGTGAWASGGTMNSAHNIAYFAGTQTAGLIAGGGTGGVSSNVALTEEYDGTAWTEVGDLLTARRGGGYGGTQNSALCMGGTVSPSEKSVSVESWNGTSWTETGDLVGSDGAAVRGAATSNTSAIAFGGNIPASPYYTANTDSFDGTSWTAVNPLNSSRGSGAPGGTATSAFYAGGAPMSPAEKVEYWDGTNWTEGADMVDGRTYDGGAGASNAAGLVFGGSAPGLSALTEQYDGSTWTEVADLATGREGIQGGGNSLTAIAAGGYAPDSTVAEEWSVPDATKTFTSS